MDIFSNVRGMIPPGYMGYRPQKPQVPVANTEEEVQALERQMGMLPQAPQIPAPPPSFNPIASSSLPSLMHSGQMRAGLINPPMPWGAPPGISAANPNPLGALKTSPEAPQATASITPPAPAYNPQEAARGDEQDKVGVERIAKDYWDRQEAKPLTLTVKPKGTSLPQTAPLPPPRPGDLNVPGVPPARPRVTWEGEGPIPLDIANQMNDAHLRENMGLEPWAPEPSKPGDGIKAFRANGGPEALQQPIGEPGSPMSALTGGGIDKKSILGAFLGLFGGL